jgi:hypothetical protein
VATCLRKKRKSPKTLIAVKKAFIASIEKLKQLKTQMVYHGHGKSFKVELLVKTQNAVKRKPEILVLRAGFEPANPYGKGFPIRALKSKRRS